MKCRLTLLSLVLVATSCYSQKNFYLQFPDSLKKATNYYSPYIPLDVAPNIIGEVSAGIPYDSINTSWHWPSSIRDRQEKAPVNAADYTGFTVVVNTTQEIDLPVYFNESYEYDSLYHSPRFIEMIVEGKTVRIPCLKDTTILFKALPVFIINKTKLYKKVLLSDYRKCLVQQVFDKHSKRKGIESLAMA